MRNFLGTLLFLLLLASCSYRFTYEGEMGRGILPRGDEFSTNVSLVILENEGLLLVQSPEEGDSKGEEAGPVRSFDLDSGDYKGDFSDEEGIPLMAREIFPLPGGNWAALSGDLNPLESHVEFTRYTPEGKVISKEQFSFPPLPEGDPEEWIHSFALNDRGDLTALYGWTRGRPGGILRIRNFTEGNRQAEIIPKEDFAHALPLSPDGPFRFWNLRYRNGRYYMTVDMKPDPYDGILILDEELNPLDYNTGYWLYNCPWDVAVDAEGRLYASNFYHDTVKVYNRDGILARTAENDKNGYREGFMNNPADLVLSCGTIYVFDSGNGRIVRFSSMIKEPLGQSNPSQRIVSYRMGQNSLLLYFYFFSAGMLLFISLNSFIFAMVFKDKSLLLLGFFFLSFLFFSIDNTFSRFFLPPLVWNLVPPYLMMIFFLLFLGTYLDRDKLPSYFARSQKIYLGIYGLYCILNTAQILTGNEGLEQFIHKSGDIITFITLLLMGIFFISQAKKGDKKSRDLLKFLGIIILFGLITPGTFTLIFIRLNLIYPPLLYNTFPLQIGFTLGGFFITFLVVKEFVNMSTSSAKAEEHSIYLKEMDKKKTRLVMNMSHELRTPLTLIKGITSQLREGRWGDSIRKNLPHLDAIDRNSDRLLDQINDFLTLSRIEQDALVLSLRKISLDRYLALTAEDYSSLAASRNIRFSLVLPDGIFLHADPELLRTALENLLGNAFKFTPEGGEIILSAESSTGEVKLSLSDLGPGIPEEDREKIFAPFEQLEGEYSRGVGLGLSLVKEIMKLHGGRAGVDSSPEGGSVFSLTFPYADEEPAAWEPAGETRRHSAPEILSDIPPGSGFKIMIVEDNRELLNYLVSELSPHFALICAENGEAALELYRENRPDLIISDIMMPRMDGWALFESLKDEAYPVPFLFLTARADREEKLKALDMGATDYLEKPFSARELLLRVKGILERSQREQDSYRKDLKSSIIKLVDEFDKERRSTAPGEAPTSLDLSALTRRETDIYHLIVRGYSDKQIGSELNISAKTVGNHNTSLFKKLGVASRMELILIDHS